MRCFRFLFVLLICAAVSGFAQTSSSAPASTKPGAGFSIDNIDKTVDPCIDFYQYACGNWLKKTEIPPDQTRWLSFVELDQRNEEIMRGILERASAGGPGRDAIDQKIGDYYASCMDEKAADA